MKFDEQSTADCLVPQECVTTPDTDPRCSDPAFAQANPELCSNSPRLILKPELVTLCELESVQFRAFLYLDGVEQELASGLVFTSSNIAVAVIGAVSGNATGVGGGIASISVAWQGFTAYAQATVLPGTNCCDDQAVGMLLVVDNSKSMTANFNGVYPTKLAYAKALARTFAGEINPTKDFGGLETFSDAATLVQGMTNDLPLLQAAVDAVPATNGFTNIYDALSDAIAYLNTQTLDKRVIVLFSDGEVREPESAMNPPAMDIIGLAQGFKDSGGIIVVVGIRSYGDGFDLLEKISTGGFFLNAYGATFEQTFTLLSGLKGYFCGGRCCPAGDRYDSHPQLNYSNFINWDVTGKVDLIGTGTGGDELFDLLPGHGMYPDMAGTQGLGKLTSKVGYTLAAGVNYRLSFKLAGNQRETVEDTFRVKIGTLLDELITFDQTWWVKPFLDYDYDIVGDGADHIISFAQESVGGGVDYIGNLLDDIVLTNLDTGEVLLLDDFNNENVEYQNPNCGPGASGYGYGYDCCYGYGCLDNPPPQQQPDPNETPDLEASQPPAQLFFATKSFTAECPAGTTGSDVTRTATATSSISQADANEKAAAYAQDMAEADLVCTGAGTGGAIVINDNAKATPYPSIISVSGLVGVITKLTVQINDFSHTYPGDVDILLVSPTGQHVMLMSDCGGPNGVVNVDLLFDDGGPALPENALITSGTWKPTNYGATDSDLPPAPAGPHQTVLSEFNGLNPNGDWKLYVGDDHEIDAGSIASWSLNFTLA